jgi:hypothetical protein
LAVETTPLEPQVCFHWCEQSTRQFVRGSLLLEEHRRMCEANLVRRLPNSQYRHLDDSRRVAREGCSQSVDPSKTEDRDPCDLFHHHVRSAQKSTRQPIALGTVAVPRLGPVWENKKISLPSRATCMMHRPGIEPGAGRYQGIP